jgi:hypothetical protein
VSERLTVSVKSGLVVVEDGDKLAVGVYTKRQWHDEPTEMVEGIDWECNVLVLD